MVKSVLYTVPPLNQNLKHSFLANLLLSDESEVGGLFQKISTAPFKGIVTFRSDPTSADYLFSPLNHTSLKKFPAELEHLKKFSRQHNKPLLIFNYGDFNDQIEIDNSIILRSAGYKSKLYENTHIIPAFVEDLGTDYGVEERSKSGTIPVIGFSGMIQTPSFLHEIKYQLRLFQTWWKIKRGQAPSTAYRGLHYRRQVVKVLESSNAVDTVFNVRKSFSGNVKTVEKDPAKLRVEFVDSIKNSDLPLVVKGDGNYSLRFFEVLSLGRIPLFIDTDSPLPLEDEIDYDSFMLRVDYTQIHKLPEIVYEFWENCSEEKYIEMQKKAREVFETKLRVDVFYKEFFQKLKDKTNI